MPDLAVINKLLDTTAITALVGTRVRPGKVAQGDTLPYIEVEIRDDNPVNHANGTTTTSFAYVDVGCFAATYQAGRALAAAVKTALSGWSDATTTPRVTMCHLQGTAYTLAQIETGQDVGRHLFTLSFMVHHYTA